MTEKWEVTLDCEECGKVRTTVNLFRPVGGLSREEQAKTAASSQHSSAPFGPKHRKAICFATSAKKV